MRRVISGYANALVVLGVGLSFSVLAISEPKSVRLGPAEPRTTRAEDDSSDDPLAPQWLLGTDPGAGFGHSVSAAGDVNGDGFADVIVGMPAYATDRGRVQLHLGSSAGFHSMPDWVVDGPEPDSWFGYSVGTAGDVNGDGFDDILVGAPTSMNRGQAFLFLGSPGLPDTTSSWDAEGDFWLAAFGLSVGTAGDVNGDGYDDVIVGAPDNCQAECTGQAKVYPGGRRGLSPDPMWTQNGTQPNAWFGNSVGTAGDVDGDGFDDVIVGIPRYDGADIGSGRVEVYLGTSHGPQSAASWWAEQEYSGRFGSVVRSAGDVNADGYADVIIGASHYIAEALVFHGSPSGLSWSPDWAIAKSSSTGYGWSVGSAGDVNADGYDDVIVGAPNYSNSGDRLGAAFVYLGSPVGLEEAPFRTLLGKLESAFGYAAGTAGDVNADGFDDVVVGAPDYRLEAQVVGAVQAQFGPLECVDEDEDSLCPPEDCDDTNAFCGEDCTDADGDDYCAGFDCDDTNPYCTEDCADGDDDGYCLGTDCDDAIASCTDNCEDFDGDGLRGCSEDCDDTNPDCGLDCTDGDGDALCLGVDCDDDNPRCALDCTDDDGDAFCVGIDCDDATADCTDDCSDGDSDFIRDCDADCDDQNQYCGLDCTDADLDGVCLPYDCNDTVPYCGLRCGDESYDGDPVPDVCDNCPLVSNVDQADSDQDGVGDVCDSCPANPHVGFPSFRLLGEFEVNTCSSGIDVGPSGNVYTGCSDEGGVYTRDGVFLWSISLQDPMEDLSGTAAGPNERLYLTREWGDNLEGRAYDGSGATIFRIPAGKSVDVDANGFVYTTRYTWLDFGNDFSDLWQWHPSGGTGYYRSFGNGDPHAFDPIRGVCVSADGYAHVLFRAHPGYQDFPNVRRFDPNGNDAGGIILDAEDDPIECAVDSHGNLYVADGSDRRITVFDSAGTLLTSLEPSNGWADILDLAIGWNNRLYVLLHTGYVRFYTAFVPDDGGDLDGDGVETPCDNCPVDSNTPQSDFDLDGQGDVCDLDDGMIYLRFDQTLRVDWQAEQGFDSWNCYRGYLAELRSGGDYTQLPGSNPVARRECGLAETWTDDMPSLDPNQAAYYLTTGMSDGMEGTLGEDGAGFTRPNAHPCP